MNAVLRWLTVAAPLAFGCWSNTASAQIIIVPNYTLYTTYSVDPTHQHAYYLVCGSTQRADGCFASGLLGSFGRIGAMLQGTPLTNGGSVARQIYVLDVANGPTRDVVALFVYTKTDTVTSTGEVGVIVKPDRKFDLPLVGGKTVTHFLAGNDSYLFAGTNKSEQAVMMNKRDLQKFSTIVAGSPLAEVAAIAADDDGYVTVVFGEPNPSFYLYDSTGTNVEDGGGQAFVLDEHNAVVPQQMAP